LYLVCQFQAARLVEINLMRTRFVTLRPLAVCALLVGCLAAVPLSGCDNRNNQQNNDAELRRQSAQATREVQKGAKELAAESKVAAANAVDGVNAIAQGVKDGVNSPKSADGGDRVDINSASTARIALLPGVSLSKAQDIVKGRPYDSPQALVHHGLLTQAEYTRIADKITAK
jgi:DNA uptake protein ComE-like DNA-binding protein